MVDKIKFFLNNNNSMNKIFFMYMKILSYFISDAFYVKVMYFLHFKKRLPLEKPETFSEKIQYIKLNIWDQKHADLVDKVKVRKFIKEKIWEEILTQLYWVWDTPDEIPYNTLPEKFVIKCNHGSWYNIIVKDKSKIDIQKISKKLSSWLDEDYSVLKKELQYKYVERKILIEEFLSDDEVGDPMDYKIFCFSGEPNMIQLDVDRFVKHTRNLYDIKWNLLPFWLKFSQSTQSIQPPKNLELMIKYANILSQDFSFARVDFYEVNWKIYFWEITFSPWNGFEKFFPNNYETDKMIWDKIIL